MMDFDLNTKSGRILAASLKCFKQYGFKRTSMEDIASETGISRAAIYLLYKNKTDVFRSLSAEFHKLTLSNAGQALQQNGEFESNITQALTARKLPFYALATSSVHGPELVDINISTSSDINIKADQSFLHLLEKAFEVYFVSADIDFATNATPQECAQIITASAAGLKNTATSIDHYETLLKQMVKIMFGGLIRK